MKGYGKKISMFKLKSQTNHFYKYCNDSLKFIFHLKPKSISIK